MAKEKVTICITTYNLEKYIGEALESILKQHTEFPYKILIADDCSTDRTLEILEQYRKEYPDIIEIRAASANMGFLANSNRIFDGLQSEYFTFLDGDDYWIDDKHLQKQVDFLESHTEYQMCAGNTQMMRDGKLAEYLLTRDDLERKYTFEDMLCDRMPFIHTSSILLRNTIFCKGIPDCFKEAVGKYYECALRGEDFRRIIHLENGPIYVFEDVFSVYRVHEKGIWQGKSKVEQQIETVISWYFQSKYYREKYGNYFLDKFYATYKDLIFKMITERAFLSEYNLTEKESMIFTGLLNDIARSKNNNRIVIDNEADYFIRQINEYLARTHSGSFKRKLLLKLMQFWQ